MDTLIRKKLLKIQDRLGMRIGIAYGTQKIPVTNTPDKVIAVLNELYKIGLKAFILPKELFSGIRNTSDLYKEHYGDLLRIRELAAKYNIELSLHYPKLSDQPDDAMRIFSSIESIMDCRTFVIRPDFYAMMPQDQALRLVVYKINEIKTSSRESGKMGVETTGRINQLGSLEEIIDIVKRTEGTEAIINWGNVHARGAGALRTEEDYKRVISQVRQNVGSQWLQNAYFIVSGMSYGPSGAIRSIPIRQSDINLAYFVKAAMSFNTKGTVIFDDPAKEQFILKNMDYLADLVR
jgi:deoxyribonuclease-4